MKRIHLFEFEDFSWFPNWIRELMTRYIEAFHKILGTSDELVKLLSEPLKQRSHLFDLCSGSGGPMLKVYEQLKSSNSEVRLTLSDLYPNTLAANQINQMGDPNLTYETDPVDATAVSDNKEAIRTMICSLHHMKPDQAKAILKDAQSNQQYFLAYEISDNSFPKWIWWIAIPFSFITVFFVTPLVRPMSFGQLFFTYIIPILPIFIAWDGAVSNARTYTLEDMDLLTQDLQSENYQWKTGAIKGKGGNKLYLMGIPAT